MGGGREQWDMSQQQRDRGNFRNVSFNGRPLTTEFCSGGEPLLGQTGGGKAQGQAGGGKKGKKGSGSSGGGKAASGGKKPKAAAAAAAAAGSGGSKKDGAKASAAASQEALREKQAADEKAGRSAVRDAGVSGAPFFLQRHQSGTLKFDFVTTRRPADAWAAAGGDGARQADSAALVATAFGRGNARAGGDRPVKPQPIGEKELFHLLRLCMLQVTSARAGLRVPGWPCDCPNWPRNATQLAPPQCVHEACVSGLDRPLGAGSALVGIPLDVSFRAECLSMSMLQCVCLCRCRCRCRCLYRCR
jgi:hypothetical protein